MGVWSIDILCGDDALEVYRRMMDECDLGPPAFKRKKKTIQSEDGHKIMTVFHTPDECRDLLHVFDEASTSLNVRVALEANMGKMLEVANERINLVDNSDKAKPRPAGNSLSIMALLMMSAGCELPPGLKSSILSGLKRDQFAKHYPARAQLMAEFAEVLSGYNSRGGQCTEWPMSDMSEALQVIKMNAATTPQQYWDEGTLLYCPFVPASRVNHKPAENGADVYSNPETGASHLCMIKGPVFKVAIETLLPNPAALHLHRAYMRQKQERVESFYVLTEDVTVQTILESERIIQKNLSPFAPPHIKIGGRVLVQGLKSETARRYNGETGTVLGDGANERIIVDLPGKSLLVKRDNLVLVFTSNSATGGSPPPVEVPTSADITSNAAKKQKPADSPVAEGPAALPAAPKQKPVNAAQVAAQQMAVGQRAAAAMAAAASAAAAAAPPSLPPKVVSGGGGGDGGKKAETASKKEEGKGLVEQLAEPAFAKMTPVVTVAKEDLRAEVGVCERSGSIIFVGDDHITLSCSERCGGVFLKLSAMLEICPAAARRVEKMLGMSCPRSTCSGKIEGLKGFKDCVAIREGNFGKGAKSGGGGGAEDSVGKDKRFSKGESYVAGAAAHEEKWMTSVDARAYARVGGGGAGCDHLYECEEETGLGQEEVEEERDVLAGKLLLGKDGNEFRAKLKILTKKDHGFLKKVKDKKKTKSDGGNVAQAAECEEELQSIEKQAPTKYPEDPEDKKSGKSQTRKIIVVKPTKKIDATSDNLEEDEEQKREEERERQNRYNWINDSSLMPLSRGEAEQIGVLEATCDVHGDSVVGRGKKKNGKQVLSLQQFHATSSLELTPGLSFEQQEELLRIEQERKDEMLARELQRIDAYDQAGQSEIDKPCYYMRNEGICPFGVNCTHSHDPKMLYPKTKEYKMYKTRMCFAFQNKGTCWNGDHCEYAHGEDELEGGGDNGYYDGDSVVNGSRGLGLDAGGYSAVSEQNAWHSVAASFSFSPLDGAKDLDWEQVPTRRGAGGDSGYNASNTDIMEAQRREAVRRVQQISEQARIRREGEQQYQAHLMYQAQKEYEQQLQAERTKHEADERAKEEEVQRLKHEEELRRHAERQEAERVFMRKFMGGGFSSLAPEFESFSPSGV